MVAGSNLSWQENKRRQCIPEGQGWYVNVRGSVQDGG